MSVRAAELIAEHESETALGEGARRSLKAALAHPETTGDQATQIARILRATRPAPKPRKPRDPNRSKEVRDALMEKFATDAAAQEQRLFLKNVRSALVYAGASGAGLVHAQSMLLETLDVDASPKAVAAATRALTSKYPDLFTVKNR